MGLANLLPISSDPPTAEIPVQGLQPAALFPLISPSLTHSLNSYSSGSGNKYFTAWAEKLSDVPNSYSTLRGGDAPRTNDYEIITDRSCPLSLRDVCVLRESLLIEIREGKTSLAVLSQGQSSAPLSSTSHAVVYRALPGGLQSEMFC